MRMMKGWLLLCVLLVSLPVHAALDIKITQGLEGATPIAIAPFEWTGVGARPESVASIVSADLKRSGRFSPRDQANFAQPDVTPDTVELYKWRQKGIEYLVVGRILPDETQGFKVQFQLFDSVKGQQLAGYSIPARSNDFRMVAHQVSDLIYETITGIKGAFNTRIAYITTRGTRDNRHYIMQVADSDGYNAKTVLDSPYPLMSPNWSPDGRKIAVVSFEKNRSHIYVQDILTGQRNVVSARKGINGAPSWSPDGTKLAMTLSESGSPQINVLDLATGTVKALTRGRTLNTEPAWMPDGQTIVFTSNRTGKPQIHKVSASGGKVSRVSFEGAYNTAPAVSPDGTKIAMINGDGGRFRVAVLDLVNRETRVITNGRLDESPSFAPNGAMIIYATEEGGRGVLAAVSDDGSIRQTLALKSGEVREPDWSPFLK